MARTTMKDVHISFPDKKHLQSFIEVLTSVLKHVEFTLNFKQGNLKIRIFGEKDSVFESAYQVKTIGKMFIQSVKPNIDGFYIHHLKLIQHIGIKIISLDSLCSALDYDGKTSFVRDKELVTKANMNEVQDTLAILYETMKQIPMNVRSKSMKKVLLTLSYCTNFDPSFIIDKGLELEYFREHKNTISISKSPDVCISELLDILSKNEIKQEYQQGNTSTSIARDYFIRE